MTVAGVDDSNRWQSMSRKGRKLARKDWSHLEEVDLWDLEDNRIFALVDSCCNSRCMSVKAERCFNTKLSRQGLHCKRVSNKKATYTGLGGIKMVGSDEVPSLIPHGDGSYFPTTLKVNIVEGNNPLLLHALRCREIQNWSRHISP